MNEITTTTAKLPAKTADKIREVLERGTSPSTRRAYRGDLAQFWGWADGKGIAETYPCPVGLVLEYITDHLDRHANSTIERRLASLSVAHRMAGVSDRDNPCRDPQVRTLLSKAKRAAISEGKQRRKKRAATADILETLMATCGDDLIGKRDRAVLAVGFASGGRRRSELANFGADDLEKVGDGYTIMLRTSKTDQAGDGITLPIMGRAAAYLDAWLSASGITSGPLFRSINKHGHVGNSITGRGISDMLKRRAKQAGLDPDQFGGHSLRSGFITEAGRQGVPNNAAMALSGHKSSRVFNGYFQAGDAVNNPAGKLLGAAG